jgi:hypothetical protein
MGWNSVDWVNLVQDRDQWWAFVNTIVILVFHNRQGMFWVADQLSAFQTYSATWSWHQIRMK